MMKKILPYLVLGLFVFVGIKSVNASEVTGNLNPGLDTGIAGVTKAVPTLSPAAGEYHATQSVSLTAAGASNICYTTDGTTAPTCASATTCNAGTALVSGGTISISSAETIKSVGCYGDGSQGPSGSSVYTFTCSTASLANGSVSAYPTCGLSCNSGYTLNGSTCVAQSTGGGGGGGGGGYVSTPCSSVTYGDWQSTCFNGIQYRNALTMTPSGCSLTSVQQTTEQRTCQTATTTPPVTPSVALSGGISNTTSDFITLEKSLVTKINQALAKRLSGRILLQVEGNGEAWYINPLDLLKYYMGRPTDAFAMMRKFGLGISEKNYTDFAKGTVPANLSGRILLRVQAHGEAYYVNPLDRKMHYMGLPADAFALMRKFGLGITNIDLQKIGVGEVK